MQKTCPKCGGMADQVRVTWDEAVDRGEAAHGLHLVHKVNHRYPLLALVGLIATGVRVVAHKFFTFRCGQCGHES